MSRISLSEPSSATTAHRGTATAPLTRVVLIATLIFVIDQTTKAWVTSWIGPASNQHRFQIVEPLLSLRYARNSGAAFGLFTNQGTLLALIAVAVIGALLIVARRNALRSLWQQVVVGLIVGGAAGNLVDRVRQGYVTDFIDVGRWPTFNLADAAITVGIVLMLVHGFNSTSKADAAPNGEQTR